MRTIVLDKGAFIAAERRSQTVADYFRAAKRAGSLIVLPTPILCEAWKGKPRYGSVSLRGSADISTELDVALACEVGVLLDASRSIQIVDASVAIVAIRYKPSIVLTSDPDDIHSLVLAAGATCGSNDETTDVVVVRV